MKVSYKSKKLEKTLTKEREIKKKYGASLVDIIIQRISELHAVDCMTDLPPTIRPHPLEPKNSEKFSIDISKHRHPTRIIFKPHGNYDIQDYSTITEIEILEIKKTHS